LKDAAHIITNSHRFEGSGEVEAGVNVVTVRVPCFWSSALFDLFVGPMGRSVACVGENATVSPCIFYLTLSNALYRPQFYSSDLTMIFSGVVACAAEVCLTTTINSSQSN
jgi:hypothetical protein